MNRITKLLALIVCIFHIAGHDAFCKQKKNIPDVNKKGNYMYYMKYADNQQTSFQDQTIQFKGEENWFTDLKEYIPSVLLTTDKGVVVQCSGGLFGMVSYKGKLLWDDGHDGGMRIFIQKNQIYYRLGGLLNSVDFNGKEMLKNQHVFTSYDFGCLDFVYPFNDGRVLAQTFAPAMNVSPQNPDVADEFTLVMMKPGQSEWVWIKELKTRNPRPLLSRDEKQLFIYDGFRLVSMVDLLSGKINNEFTIPQILYLCAMSIDFSGNFIAAFFDEENTFCIASFDAAGKQLWLYKSDKTYDQSDFSQIAVSNDGTIYCLIGDSLFYLKNGTLAGSVTIPASDRKRYMTACADCKVLVTSGNLLMCFDSRKESLSEALLKENAYTPPVADAAGNVYVGTKTGIYSFR